MAVTFNNGEQIIILNAPGDVVTKNGMAVDSIILRSTAAGVFNIRLGNTTMALNTTTNNLTLQLRIDRHVNEIELVSGPTNMMFYVLLEQKR